MKGSTIVRLMVVTAGAVVAPVVALAPRPTGSSSVSELVEAARASNLQGWALVDEATQLVHAAYQHYSAWHLWETPMQSLAHGRGRGQQVNAIVARVLTELGFEVELVHAARVRAGRNPWWHAGHVWARVTIADEVREVCAMLADNRAGQVGFVPVTEVLPVRAWTHIDTTLGLAPFVIAQVWRQLLRGDDPPRWMYRRFGERA